VCRGRWGRGADAGIALGDLLKGWPKDVPSKPQAIAVTPTSATVSVRSKVTPSPFLRAIKGPDGWAMAEPRLNAADNITRLTLQFQAANQERSDTMRLGVLSLWLLTGAATLAAVGVTGTRAAQARRNAAAAQAQLVVVRSQAERLIALRGFPWSNGRARPPRAARERRPGRGGPSLGDAVEPFARIRNHAAGDARGSDDHPEARHADARAHHPAASGEVPGDSGVPRSRRGRWPVSTWPPKVVAWSLPAAICPCAPWLSSRR
jgi:hypothetical protein